MFGSTKEEVKENWGGKVEEINERTDLSVLKTLRVTPDSRTT